MLDAKLILALLISTVLAILIFRTNYTKDIKISRAKYTERGQYNYIYLLTDIMVSIAFALIGCYISWDSITTIDSLKGYASYKFVFSILNGVLFQQILPIIIEIAMNKINAIKNSNS